MDTPEQYELKIGVYHHPSLKTTQLIQFLQNESNEFLSNELPQALSIQQPFVTIFEPLSPTSRVDYNEYVGLVILYNSASLESFNYAKSKIPSSEQLNDMFLLFVEMDNTEKKLNVIGNEGEDLCNQIGLLFIRLSLYNSEDLVTNLNRSIYYLVQNYYYPNEEDRPKEHLQEYTPQKDQFILDYSDSQNKLIVTTAKEPEKKKQILDLIERASRLRQNRERQKLEEQDAIDASIKNVEKVLNNINGRIKQKLESNWFSTLKDSLYKPIQKKSNIYHKIKLTQQFIQETPQKHIKASSSSLHDSIFNSKYNSVLQQQLKKIQHSLMKLVLTLDDINFVELEVYQNSTYDELAILALKKLGFNQTEKNLKTIKEKIKSKIQTYIKELLKAVKVVEKQRTYERSYLTATKK